jgi:hypothetical protein
MSAMVNRLPGRKYRGTFGGLVPNGGAPALVATPTTNDPLSLTAGITTRDGAL